MKRWLILVVILALAAVGAAGYLGYRSNQPQVIATPAAPATVPVTTCDVEQTVTAPGNLINTDEIKINMPVTGRLAEILIQAGDQVQAGQTLARLDDREQYEASLAAAQLELLQAQQARLLLDQNAPLQTAEAQVALAQAQKALDDLVTDNQLAQVQAQQAVADAQAAVTTAEQHLNNLSGEPHQKNLTAAKADLVLAQQDLKYAQAAFDQYKDLAENHPTRAYFQVRLSAAQKQYDDTLSALEALQGPAYENDLAQAQATLLLAQTQLSEAQRNWETTKSGPDPVQRALLNARLNDAQARWETLQNGPASLEVSLADAKVAEAEAKLASAQEVLANLEIKAPFDGVILDVAARTDETIPSGTSLFTIHDPSNVEVEATVIEEDYAYVEAGQPVSLFFDALPSETITGLVSRVLPKRAPGDRPLYYLYMSLDRVPDKLVSGMSADASIIIAQRKGVLCLPRAVVKASSSGSAVVEVWANWQKEKRTVQVGLRGDTYVEILSGLKEGEQVVAR